MNKRVERDKREETEYRAKVMEDNGLTRSRVPAPLLREMGARPDDYLIFRLSNTGEVVMRVSRLKKAGKSIKRGKAKPSKRA